MKWILLIGVYILTGFSIMLSGQAHTSEQLEGPGSSGTQSQPTIETQSLYQKLWHVYQEILHEDAQAQAAAALHAEPMHNSCQTYTRIPDFIPETDSLLRARELISLSTEPASSKLDKEHTQSPNHLDASALPMAPIATASTKRFKCSQCGNLFNRKYHLVTHMHIHTGKKSYSCLQCTKSFRQKSHLTRHMLIHTGAKPYKCTHCARPFRQACHLTIHMRTHTGAKPYKCTHCPKSFKQQSNLATHIKRMHKNMQIS